MAKTYRQELEELRDYLWTTMQTADTKDRAALSARYLDTIKILGGMEATTPQEGSKADELADRRAKRLTDSTGS